MTAIGLPLDARILVCENPGHVAEHATTWAEFIDANRDGMDLFELSLIASTLQIEGIYHGDEGAGGRWTVRRAT